MVRSSAQLSLVCPLLAALLLLGGCSPNEKERAAWDAVWDYHNANFPAAEAKLRPLAEQTNGDFVLNNLRLGSATLAAGELDQAEAAFLRAYEVLNSVGVNNGGRSLGAVVVGERIKVWKGEPFERAMANHYLGLIYYMRGDYANARAAYENALFKLRDYADDHDNKNDAREVDSDFALASIMLGKCWLHLGRTDLAQANFDRAASLRPELTPVVRLASEPENNVLLAVDFGYGPQKVYRADGSLAGFRPTPYQVGGIPFPAVDVDGRPYDLQGAVQPPVDLLALAQQQRWQSIDTIRTVKNVVGYGLMAAGAYEGLARRHNDPLLGAALFGTGLLLHGSAAADVRYWDTLPRTTFILPLRLPPGTHTITVDFPGAGVRQTWRGLIAPEQGEATYYYRMMRWSTGPFDWPATPPGGHP
jgi:tetratricopeptide (TPR) repeat protein